MITLRIIQVKAVMMKVKITSKLYKIIRRLYDLSYAKLEDERHRYAWHMDNSISYYLMLTISAKITKANIWVLKQEAKESMQMRHVIDRLMEADRQSKIRLEREV